MAEENLTTNKKNISEESENGNIEGSSSFVKGIRTLENDIASYTKEKNFSILDIVAEEAKVRGLSFENPEMEESFFSKYKKNIAVVIIALIVFGGGYWGVVNFIKRNTATRILMQDKIIEGPILTDHRIEVETYQDKKEVFLDKIEEALGGDNSGSKLTEISLVKSESERKVSLNKEEFFAVAGIDAPQGLSDFLGKNFMLLNLKNNNGDYPIIVLKSNSYNYVFSEMLKWEKEMLGNFGAIFSQSDFMGEDVFVDKYVQNHDARVLENNGETKLIYSFADRKYLIITNNEEALTDIFKKLTSANYINPKAEW
ncbi:MAG: hypothetical protein AAB822_01455 [Patescibacteria group bacterium]